MEALNLISYSIYTVFIVVITLLVAKILFKNSGNYMTEIFSGNHALAESTNQLFRLGFFLLALGTGFWYLEIPYLLETKVALFEKLSIKIGGFTLFLGVLLFFNLMLFFRGMKAKKQSQALAQQNQAR